MGKTRSSPGFEALCLGVAVAAMASSVVFLRWSTLAPGEVSGWRMMLAVLCFAPMVGAGWSGLTRRDWGYALVAGVFLGLHFVTWTIGARTTVAANATLLVNLVPLVLPFLLHTLAAEPARSSDWQGAVLGFAGVLVVVGANYQVGGGSLGDGICLISMLMLAVYLALGRRAASRFRGTAPWVVPVFAVAALVCFGAELVAGRGLAWPPPGEWKWVAALLVFPTLLGHGMMARALRYWRGQVVGVASAGQFLFALLYGWLAFGEVPTPWYPVGAALVVVGVWRVASPTLPEADGSQRSAPEDEPKRE